MATSDMKQFARSSARTKTNPTSRQVTQPTDNVIFKHENTFGLFTKGSRIANEPSINRERVARPALPVSNNIRGMTLEDYVRGRTTSENLQPPPRHKPKDSSVVRIKYEETGLCFDQTFQIQEQDEDNYSQNRNEQMTGTNGFLPGIKQPISRRNRHIKHVQTQACQQPTEYSPQMTRPNRLMTSYNQQLFLPIHSLGRDKPHMRRSFYRRDQRSKSNSQKDEEARIVRNRSKEIQELAKKSVNFKTNTLSDFYKIGNVVGRDNNRLEKNIRVDLGYVTKYANKFRLNPLLEGKGSRGGRKLM